MSTGVTQHHLVPPNGDADGGTQCQWHQPASPNVKLVSPNINWCHPMPTGGHPTSNRCHPTRTGVTQCQLVLPNVKLVPPNISQSHPTSIAQRQPASPSVNWGHPRRTGVTQPASPNVNWCHPVPMVTPNVTQQPASLPMNWHHPAPMVSPNVTQHHPTSTGVTLHELASPSANGVTQRRWCRPTSPTPRCHPPPPAPARGPQ